MARTHTILPAAWTPGDTAVLAALWQAGARGEDVAARLGRTVTAVWAKARELGVRNGAKSHGGPESEFWRTAGRFDKALSMARNGETMEAIAAALGCSRNAVIGKLNRSSLYREDCQRGGGLEERLARYPEPKGCRYIAGDVLRDGIHWCDAPITVVGRSYCNEHHALCWQQRGES